MTASSNVVGCSIGSSAGRAPLLLERHVRPVTLEHCDPPATAYFNDVKVKARMMWRWAITKTASTGATTNMLPAMMMCQRAPVPSSP